MYRLLGNTQPKGKACFNKKIGSFNKKYYSFAGSSRAHDSDPLPPGFEIKEHIVTCNLLAYKHCNDSDSGRTVRLCSRALAADKIACCAGKNCRFDTVLTALQNWILVDVKGAKGGKFGEEDGLDDVRMDTMHAKRPKNHREDSLVVTTRSMRRRSTGMKISHNLNSLLFQLVLHFLTRVVVGTINVCSILLLLPNYRRFSNGHKYVQRMGSITQTSTMGSVPCVCPNGHVSRGRSGARYGWRCIYVNPVPGIQPASSWFIRGPAGDAPSL